MTREEFEIFNDNEQALKQHLQSLDKNTIIELYLQKEYDFTFMRAHYKYFQEQLEEENKMLRERLNKR